MILAAEKNRIFLILLTPTGSEDARLEDASDPLAMRAALIRELAGEYNLPLADVAARWQEVVQAGTEQKELLSQINHPNREGHSIAAKEILRVLDEVRGSVEESRAISHC